MEEQNIEEVKIEEKINNQETASEEIQIADEVISIIAGKAVSEVSGVAGMAGGFAGGISPENVVNKIKQFETLQLCFEELLSTIENDTCIDYSFYSKKLFRQDIEEYIKSNGKEVHKSRQVLHILSKCIEHNRPTYIKLSFKKIEDIIFQKGRFKKENLMSILIELDPIITNLGCELVNIGFSKINIYLKTRRIFEHTRDFKKAFEIFKSIFTNTNPIKHTVIFRFRLPQKLISLNIFNETLDQTYITEYTKRFKRNFT